MKHIQDPRMILIALAVSCLTILLVPGTVQLHLLMGLTLLYLLCMGRIAASGGFAAAYLLLWGLVLILPARAGSMGVVLFSTLRTMPMLAFGMLLFGTPPNVIMLTGAKMRLPKNIVIMLCILLRFSFVIVQEMRTITQGIRARGLLPRWYSVFLHPVRSYECFVLPLIIRGLRLSAELSCAAEFRGIESNCTRTCIHETRLLPLEVVCTLLYFIGCVGIFVVGRLLL